MNDFIRQKVNEYKSLMRQVKTDEAYFAMGMAMHPIMDSTSPSHEGMQEWKGINGPAELGEAGVHISQELMISDERLSRTVNHLREFYTDSK